MRVVWTMHFSSPKFARAQNWRLCFMGSTFGYWPYTYSDRRHFLVQ
jgi:hypothetical protein